MPCSKHISSSAKDCVECLANAMLEALKAIRSQNKLDGDKIKGIRQQLGAIKSLSLEQKRMLSSLATSLNIKTGSVESLQIRMDDAPRAPLLSGAIAEEEREAFRERLRSMGTWIGVDELEVAARLLNVSFDVMFTSDGGRTWTAMRIDGAPNGTLLGSVGPRRALAFEHNHYEVGTFTAAGGDTFTRTVRTRTNGLGDCALESLLILYTLSNVPASFDTNVRAATRQFRASHQTHQANNAGTWNNTSMAIDNDYQQSVGALRGLLADEMTAVEVDRTVRAEGRPDAKRDKFSDWRSVKSHKGHQYGAPLTEICPCGHKPHPYGVHRLAPLVDSDDTIAAVAALYKQLSKFDVTRVRKTTNPKALLALQKQTQKGRDVDIRGRTLRIMSSKRDNSGPLFSSEDADDKVPAKMLGAIRAVTNKDRVLAFVTASGLASMSALKGQTIRIGKTDFIIEEGGLEQMSLYGRRIELDQNLGGDPISMKPCAAKKLMTLVGAALDHKKGEQVVTLAITETDWTSGKQMLVGGKSATQEYIIGDLSNGLMRVRSCENCVRYLSRYICDQGL